MLFHLSNGPKDFRGPRKEPKEIIIEKLHFDSKQIAQYEALIATHRNTINTLDSTIKKLKRELYATLIENETPTNKTDSLFQAITEKQMAIEKVHFNHFLDIKKICKEEQLADYENLTAELAKIFSNKPPKK
ncbi:periplasmic heavy metal sensor [Flavobacterium sp. J27]|uniref:periplasmic heavy metal sensor n=1 Tax=Flavobacterium sp. J27 TaxID=2060419 RepID=UPI0013EED71B|nr:periplasmic heavy metal sensor [Flavobacterium sp. J27]